MGGTWQLIVQKIFPFSIRTTKIKTSYKLKSSEKLSNILLTSTLCLDHIFHHPLVLHMHHELHPES